MTTRPSFAPGEWYHCYARGVDKRKVFISPSDYERFILALHIFNGHKGLYASDLLRHHNFNEILSTIFQEKPLVEIGVFCLMPNHFHLVLKEVTEGGISLFMQKVLTSYTMYFNKKHERTGALLSGTFHSKHVYDDRYFKKICAYIHLNPIELEEGKWKIGKGDIDTIESRLKNYRYSSLSAFVNNDNPANILISKSVFEIFDSPFNLREALIEAQDYYLEHVQLVKV